MFQKLEDVEKRYEELNKKISDPEIIAKQSEWQKYMKEHAALVDVAEKYKEYKKTKAAMEEAKEMMADKELKELAEVEYQELKGKLPKIEDNNEFEKHLYNKQEINRILERFKDDDTFTCAFITSCFTGMRTGEVCSLTWEDIDFKNRVINVKHTVYDKTKDEKGRWYIGTTKTKQGTRQVNMCETLYNALLNYKKKQQYLKKMYGNQYMSYHFEDVKNKYGKIVEKRIVQNQNNILQINNANMVFVRENGKYVGRNILNYPFKIIHKELGIENCRFYDLRGSYATINLRNGVEIRDVADILGHKFIETTENFYISSTYENKKDVSDVFDNFMTSDTINEIIKYKIVY